MRSRRSAAACSRGAGGRHSVSHEGSGPGFAPPIANYYLLRHPAGCDLSSLQIGEASILVFMSLLLPFISANAYLKFASVWCKIKMMIYFLRTNYNFIYRDPALSDIESCLADTFIIIIGME